MAPIPSPALPAALRSLTGTSSAATSDELHKRLLIRFISSVPLPPSLLRSSFFRRALSIPSSPASLAKRDTLLGIIPPSYQYQGPSPGTLVGIVLGSVGGFLLIVILFWLLTKGNANNTIEADETVVSRRRSRAGSPARSSHGHRHRSSRRSGSMRQVSRSPGRGPTRVIVEERIRERDIGGAPPPPRPASIIVEERRETVRESGGDRRVEGDDIVEVIEEHSDIRSPVSPPRRRDSDRRRSRRSSGYRSVDPNLYAGGNYPQHPIRRRDDEYD